MLRPESHTAVSRSAVSFTLYGTPVDSLDGSIDIPYYPLIQTRSHLEPEKRIKRRSRSGSDLGERPGREALLPHVLAFQVLEVRLRNGRIVDDCYAASGFARAAIAVFGAIRSAL